MAAGSARLLRPLILRDLLVALENAEIHNERLTGQCFLDPKSQKEEAPVPQPALKLQKNCCAAKSTAAPASWIILPRRDHASNAPVEGGGDEGLLSVAREADDTHVSGGNRVPAFGHRGGNLSRVRLARPSLRLRLSVHVASGYSERKDFHRRSRSPDSQSRDDGYPHRDIDRQQT